MAQQRRSGGGKGIPTHPLVEALASDPSKPPENATRLFGFPGPAAEPKSTRLWLDADLSSYVEVPDEAIVHSQTLDNDQGTILWVEPSATLTHSTTTSQEVQAEFLGGSIAGGNLAAAGPTVEWGSPLGGFTGETRAFPCEPRPFTFAWGACPKSEVVPCLASADFPCQTPNFPCHSRGIVCESVDLPCMTDPRLCEPVLSNLRCPSRAVPCPTPPVVTRDPGCGDPEGGGITPVVDPVGPFRPKRFR